MLLHPRGNKDTQRKLPSSQWLLGPLGKTGLAKAPGGGASLGVTQPKVTRPPALQNHSPRARAEKHSGNPAGPQLVLRPHQMENQRSPEEFHL